LAGNFHEAVLPKGRGWDTFRKNRVFAEGWSVTKRTIDVVSPAIFGAPSGICSIDLDGHSVGGITNAPFPTIAHAAYMLTFLFSGNGECSPPVKTMVVKVGQTQTHTFTWDVASEGSAEAGNFQLETWAFTADDSQTSIIFDSLDKPAHATCGPVVAAVSVTRT
jgi:hypothetical protein